MANIQNPNAGDFADKKQTPQQDRWNSSQKADQQKADRRTSNDREIESEPQTPYKPEIPQRNLPDVQAGDTDSVSQ